MTRDAEVSPRAVATDPSTNGRTPRGRFARGNPGGPGNPYARRVAWLRAALIDAVTNEDMRDVARVLVARAKDGDVGAIRELLDRTVGKPQPLMDTEASEPIMSLTDAQIAAVAQSIARPPARAMHLTSRLPGSSPDG